MTSPTPLQQLKTDRLLPGPALHNLVRIEGTLTTASPLHVGSGEIRESTEKTLPRKLMLVEGERGEDLSAPVRPWIPGSSLRGVLRSWAAAVLAPYGADVARFEDVEAPEEAEPPAPDRVSDVDAWKVDRQRAEDLRDDLDLVGGLFGSTRWRGKLEIRSATLPNGKAIKPEHINRVAIDPHLGSAEQGKLFSVEYVPKGVAFQVDLVARNVRPWELGLLLFALDSFNHAHFSTRVGALGNADWGRMTWSPTRISRLGAVADGPLKGNPLADWILATKEGREAQPIADKERDGFKALCTTALQAALRAAGG